MASLLQGYPQHIINTILRTWLNSWATARRFQSSKSTCVFCREWMSQDSIEHLAVCRITNLLAHLSLHIGFCTPSLSLFLLLEARNPMHLTLLALHLHATYHTYNKLKHDTHTRNDEQHVQAIKSIYTAILAKEVTCTPWGRNVLFHHSISLR